MFWERFLRLFKGYVEFCAEGGFPERFINLCASNRISVREIRMTDETITACVPPKDYSLIRKAAKKSGMKVRLVSKKGLPFFIRKNRFRSGLVIGLFLMIVINFFLSERIWIVSVTGNEKIPAEEIASAFEEMGVRTGVKKEDLNAKAVAGEALEKMDSLMWCAVNVDGSRADIEVKERVEKEIEMKDETPSNIIAVKSGQIKLIECFQGTPVTEAGSAVEKGDVLVSGAVINKDESVDFYHAEANVMALTENTVSVYIPNNQQMRVYGKPREKKLVSFFKITLPLNFIFSPKGEYSFSVNEDFLMSENCILPLGIITKRYAPFERKNIRISVPTTRLMCTEEYFRQKDISFDDIRTESMTCNMKEDKKGFSLVSVFQCIENIGKSAEMDLEIQ